MLYFELPIYRDALGLVVYIETIVRLVVASALAEFKRLNNF